MAWMGRNADIKDGDSVNLSSQMLYSVAYRILEVLQNGIQSTGYSELAGAVISILNVPGNEVVSEGTVLLCYELLISLSLLLVLMNDNDTTHNFQGSDDTKLVKMNDKDD
ncbi:hypothetical protein Tco_0685876 [Tanacetum coccineum]